MIERFPEAYAIYNNDDAIRFKSTSGGIFSILSEFFIDVLNGVVYGAAFDGNFEVRHIRVNSLKEIDLLRGSKYPQSKIGNVFRTAKKDLDNGKYVLFVGTPCQINGFKNFLGKNYDNLYCLDFVCHGVASDGIWRDYLNSLKSKGEISNIVFKHKYKGWKKWYFHVDYKDGKVWQRRGYMTSFMQSYLTYTNVRPSCYNCSFKGLKRNSDFTISDCWGIGETDNDLNDDRGLSALLLQNDRAKVIFEKIKDGTTYKQYDAYSLMEGNWTAFKPVTKSKIRDSFFRYAHENSGLKALRKFFKPQLKQWVLYYLYRIEGKEK